MSELFFEVDADVIAADGGSDGAYDLLGTHTADELVELLRGVLKKTVRSMLFNGSVDSGYVLRIAIRDAGSEPKDPIQRLAEIDELPAFQERCFLCKDAVAPGDIGWVYPNGPVCHACHNADCK